MQLLSLWRARMSRCATAFIALVVCSPLAGCYSYRTSPPGSLVAGADVRLRLTPEASATLSESEGLRMRTLHGSVQQVSADGSLQMMPADVTTIAGDSLPWRRGVITLPLQAIETAERRTVNRRRTAGLAAAITGVFTAAVIFTFRNIWGRGGATLGQGPGVPD